MHVQFDLPIPSLPNMQAFACSIAGAFCSEIMIEVVELLPEHSTFDGIIEIVNYLAPLAISSLALSHLVALFITLKKDPNGYLENLAEGTDKFCVAAYVVFLALTELVSDLFVFGQTIGAFSLSISDLVLRLFGINANVVLAAIRHTVNPRITKLMITTKHMACASQAQIAEALLSFIVAQRNCMTVLGVRGRSTVLANSHQFNTLATVSVGRLHDLRRYLLSTVQKLYRLINKHDPIKDQLDPITVGLSEASALDAALGEVSSNAFANAFELDKEDEMDFEEAKK